MQFYIHSMTCSGCARSVTKAIQSVDANAQVTVDAPHRRVQVLTTASQAEIAEVLTEAGYPAEAL